MSGSGEPAAADDRERGLRWLNALPPEQAERQLLACCGSRVWAGRMAADRPYPDARTLLDAAERVWWSLGAEDWKEAFAAHPRLGERHGGGAPAWSRQEQAAVGRSDQAERAALAGGNQAYEARFGHVFLIRAAGRGAAEMLDELRRRLQNPPETELRVAAGQQSEITRLRLEKLLAAAGAR